MSASLATATSPTYDVPRASAESALRLESWYHGKITRVRSEALVQAEGDFLVRDSISSPSDYVLTVFWKGRAIHFQINKAPSRKSSTAFFFQFEDEQFESISDLVSFHQVHRKPITIASGCIILNPVPNIAALKRFDPGADIEQNYMKICRFNPTKPSFDRSLSQQVLLNETRRLCMNRVTSLSTTNLSESQKAASAEKEHFTLSELLSRPLPIPEKSPAQDDQEEYCEMDYDAMEEAPVDIVDASVTDLARRSQHASLLSLNSVKLSPVASMTQSCHDVSKLNWRTPRMDSVPSLPERKTCPSMRDSGFVADASDYDHPLAYQKPGPSGISESSGHYVTFTENGRSNIAEFAQRLRYLMTEKGPAHCALLILQEDCRLLRFLVPPKTNGKKCINGLSLLLLPQGTGIREELIERGRCLQFVCVLSILGVSKVFRSKILSLWISVANSLIFELGNTYSFLTVISALCSKPIARDLALWKSLDKSVGEHFHSKLVPLADCLRQGNELPRDVSDITVPLLQPVLDLLSNTPSSFFLDTSSVPAQIESLWKWLEMSREWSVTAEAYQRPAIKKCGNLVPKSENFLSVDYCSKALFGPTTCPKDPKQRYERLLIQINSLVEKL